VLRERAARGEPIPTYRELQAELGFKSTASVRDHLRALSRKGFVSLAAGRARGVRLTQTFVHATYIPLVDRSAPGLPNPSKDQFAGFVPVPTEWVQGDTFALEVVGDSMRDAGIFEGDIAVLRRTQNVRSGQIVCAIIDGEATLKYFERRRDGTWLFSANVQYRAIRITDRSILQGVVQAIVRIYRQSPLWVRSRARPSSGSCGRYGAR
jgi:repressor LexA